jgi:5-methylthioadenosine/S-adenosylhomocysteine deaminase
MPSTGTLIEARWVVPVRPRARVLEGHAVVLEQDRIADILPAAQARQRYPQARRLSLERHALIPGLVNAHAHCAMALLRGVGDDLTLDQWLQRRVWPLERAIVGPEFVYDGTRLAALEMLRAGVTCCNEMYFYPAEAVQGLRSVGLRAAVGIVTIDFPTRYAKDADEYLRQGLTARDAALDDPRVSFTLAPHAPYTVSDATMRRTVALAEELDLPLHIHVHETAREIDESVSQHGVRPLERLDRLGVVSERLIAVHATHLTMPEIELLARRGASVAHCPTSNLKLACGVAPVAELLQAGAGVAIGTDGAASNNRLDVLREANLAALLAKGRSQDACVLPSWAALECATLGGARALGLEARVGTIEIGKEADLAALDLGGAESQPCHDVISQIIYCAGRESVTHVWVAGEALLAERRVVRPGEGDLEQEVMQAAAPWQNQIRQRLRELALGA